MKYGDVARNAQGQDMYVGFDVFSDPHQLFMTNLATGEKTPLLTTSFGANTDTGVQVSGRALQRPGWGAGLGIWRTQGRRQQPGGQ